MQQPCSVINLMLLGQGHTQHQILRKRPTYFDRKISALQLAKGGIRVRVPHASGRGFCRLHRL